MALLRCAGAGWAASARHRSPRGCAGQRRGGHLFANTTNPAQACGEGIALAWQAGAAVEDLEFVQFHPTAIRLDDPCFLISEAVRGEGGVLVDALGAVPWPICLNATSPRAIR